MSHTDEWLAHIGSPTAPPTDPDIMQNEPSIAGK